MPRPAPKPVQLELLPSPMDPAQWRSACQLALGLGRDEADRLAAARPVKLLARVDPARAVSLLGAKIGAATREAAPCPTHRLLLTTSRCPVCGEYRACPVCLTATPPACDGCGRKLRFRRRFKALRVAALLFVLLAVAWTTWSGNRRLSSWRTPFTVGIYPINSTSDPVVGAWIAGLRPRDFEPVAGFLSIEARKRGRSIGSLVTLRLLPPIASQPPAAPTEGSAWDAISWSLHLRWWAWRAKARASLPPSDVVFVRYHPRTERRDLDASVGLREGHLGVIETVAGEQAAEWTRLAVAHELLHTLGAPDAYGPDGPLDPQGLADPHQQPRFPQRRCEVMAGQIAISPTIAEPAGSLSECVVGDATAKAIGW